MNWKVVVASVLVGGAGLLFFQYESEKARSRQRATQNKSMGKPLVGGPFHLVDTKGNPVSDRNFRGKYMLIYFGFAHCPDICPRELSKMTDVMNVMDAVLGPIVQPIMISVDPGRDTPEALEEYRKSIYFISFNFAISRISQKIISIIWLSRKCYFSSQNFSYLC